MNVYVVVTEHERNIGVLSVSETVSDALYEIYKQVNKNYEYDLYSEEDIENEIDKDGYFLSNEIKYYIKKSEIV